MDFLPIDRSVFPASNFKASSPPTIVTLFESAGAAPRLVAGSMMALNSIARRANLRGPAFAVREPEEIKRLRKIRPNSLERETRLLG